MKIAIIGAGAMGTLFGTAIIKNTKNDVTFYEAWDQLLEQKIKVAKLITDTTEEIPVVVKDLKTSKEQPADLVVFFVKSSATAESIERVHKAGLVNKETVLLTCQGGFDNPDLISKYIDPTHILVGCTVSFCKACGPMQITNFGVLKTTAWPYKFSTKQQLPQRISDLVNQLPCLQIELTPAAVADTWKMQLYYSTNIAFSAITNLSFGASFKKPEGVTLLNHLASECALVARLEGVDESIFNEQVAIQAVADLAVSCESHMGSMHGDLSAGRKTEIDGTAGALIRKAALHNVKIPYTEAVWCMVRSLEK